MASMIFLSRSKTRVKLIMKQIFQPLMKWKAFCKNLLITNKHKSTVNEKTKYDDNVSVSVK